MKNNIKSNTGFSKKLITIFILAGIATLTQATDNSIFIDQTGSNSSITINQDGAGNRIGGLTGTPGDQNRAIMYGDGQTININQVGANNSLQFDVRTIVGSGNTNANNDARFTNANGNNFVYSAVGNLSLIHI